MKRVTKKIYSLNFVVQNELADFILLFICYILKIKDKKTIINQLFAPLLVQID